VTRELLGVLESTVSAQPRSSENCAATWFPDANLIFRDRSDTMVKSRNKAMVRLIGSWKKAIATNIRRGLPAISQFETGQEAHQMENTQANALSSRYPGKLKGG